MIPRALKLPKRQITCAFIDYRDNKEFVFKKDFNEWFGRETQLAIQLIYDRLKINNKGVDINYNIFEANCYWYLDGLTGAESRWKNYSKATNTTAFGYSQFTKDSLRTVVNSYINRLDQWNDASDTRDYNIHTTYASFSSLLQFDHFANASINIKQSKNKIRYPDWIIDLYYLVNNKSNNNKFWKNFPKNRQDGKTVFLEIRKGTEADGELYSFVDSYDKNLHLRIINNLSFDHQMALTLIHDYNKSYSLSWPTLGMAKTYDELSSLAIEIYLKGHTTSSSAGERANAEKFLICKERVADDFFSVINKLI